MSKCFPNIDMFTVSTVIKLNDLGFQSLGNNIVFEEISHFKGLERSLYFYFARFQGIVNLFNFVAKVSKSFFDVR